MPHKKKVRTALSDRDLFDSELKRLATCAGDDLRYLHRVTGKWGLDAIDPLDLKVRWSERCWDRLGRLVDLKIMLTTGRMPFDMHGAIIEGIRPVESWVVSDNSIKRKVK